MGECARPRERRGEENAKREKRGRQTVSRDSLDGLHRKRETARSPSYQSRQQENFHCDAAPLWHTQGILRYGRK